VRARHLQLQVLLVSLLKLLFLGNTHSFHHLWAFQKELVLPPDTYLKVLNSTMMQKSAKGHRVLTVSLLKHPFSACYLPQELRVEAMEG
jgi:hypothetical protein